MPPPIDCTTPAPPALAAHPDDEVRRNLATFADTFVLSVPDGPPLPYSEWPLPRIQHGEIALRL